MKNLFTLIAMVGCFTILSFSSATAQDYVRNYTNCDFLVKVAYGPVGSCTSTGTITTLVPAGSGLNIGIPAGTDIKVAKGRYNATSSCPFYVGQSACGPYTNIDNVTCSTNCGNYTASFSPTVGIKLYN